MGKKAFKRKRENEVENSENKAEMEKVPPAKRLAEEPLPTKVLILINFNSHDATYIPFLFTDEMDQQAKSSRISCKRHKPQRPAPNGRFKKINATPQTRIKNGKIENAHSYK